MRIGRKSIVLFGRSSEGVKPTTTNVQVVVEYEKPRTKKQLRQFLGIIQFYNRFIPNCAKILGPLYSLTSTENRTSRISWTPETDKCFARAKTVIIYRRTILAHPNHEADLELIIDASDRAVGAVLQQILCGKSQSLAFWSKALTPAQKAWSCFERELFACYASIKHFQYF